jgi:hypothetical protein
VLQLGPNRNFLGSFFLGFQKQDRGDSLVF